ncbi:MAG: DUF2179 domain-containing protein [Anaerolineae bacterium]|nr:DUF2179 domain-containing protein [Anaerolineae bacterium]
MELEALLVAGGIFALRVIGNMMTTLRLVLIVRGQKLLSTVLAAFEALIFALVLGSVVTNLDNVLNLAAYCLGFAVGGYLGLVLEQHLIQRFISVTIISAVLSHDVAVAVREAGFGATEGWGEGAHGRVGSVTAVVGHQEIKQIVKIAQAVDPDAFVTMEELRSISRGYFRFARHGH